MTDTGIDALRQAYDTARQFRTATKGKSRTATKPLGAISTATGFPCVWMTVFQNHPSQLDALARIFPRAPRHCPHAPVPGRDQPTESDDHQAMLAIHKIAYIALADGDPKAALDEIVDICREVEAHLFAP